MWDPAHVFRQKCNREMVVLEELNDADIEIVRRLLANHFHYTKSPVAQYIEKHGFVELKKFIKVMPLEYKRILEQQAAAQKVAGQEVSDG
jgi:glutamate synthase domain-containing protein 3